MVHPTARDFIRVTIASEVDDYSALADKVAVAAGALGVRT